MPYPFLIIFALVPSIIWLLFYLRKDAHPESNQMILKIFFWGILAAIGAVFIELGFFHITAESTLSPLLISLFNIFVGVALVEEVLKYLVVKKKVLSSSELDEPLDIMLYMIIAALGFVFLENFLIFLSPQMFFLDLGAAIALTAFRFISATFLHTLASGTLGFFLAISFLKVNKRNLFLTIGFLSAVILHGFYNFSIMILTGHLKFVLPMIIIIGLAIFVSFGFKKLKKMQGVCKIN